MNRCQKTMSAGLQLCKKQNNFIVRRATSLDDLQWVMKPFWSTWVRPSNEAQWYFNAGLTKSFFIGEVDGQKMSSISFVDHGKSRGFASSYFVDNAFRGMGYGAATTLSVFSNDVLNKYTLFGCSVPSLQKFYNKTLRLNAYWSSRRFQMHIPALMKRFTGKICSGQAIQPVSLFNLEHVMTYYASNMILGSSDACKHLLYAMISDALNSSWVVMNSNNEISGVLIMHKTTKFPSGGYIIRPFFADNVLVARSLLRTAIEYAAQDCNSFISLDVPLFNSECVSLMDEMRADAIDDRVFVASKDVSQKALTKVYGMANLDSII